MKKETKNLIALIVIGLLIMCIPKKTKAQKPTGFLLECSGGYTTGLKAPTVIGTFGYAAGDGELYLKFQPHLTMRSNVVTILGLHAGFIIFDNLRINTGIDYHAGSTDYVNTLNGYFFAYGIQYRYKETPFIISADMSGKFLSICAGLSVVLQ